MATITRPGKEGNTTTYQGKVAAGYTKILAQEVDADIDAIYSAWNAGVDTVNIKDGAVTTPKIGGQQVATGSIADGAVTQAKLAAGVNATGPAGGDLTGTYPNPALGTIQSGAVHLAPRATLLAQAQYVELEANLPGSSGYDASKPAYVLRLDYTGDNLVILRAPAGTTTFTTILAVSGAGRLFANLSDTSVFHNQLAINAIYGPNVVINAPANFNLSTPNVWTPFATLPSMTTRGALVALFANHNLSVSGPVGGGVCSERWLRDGSVVCTRAFLVASASGMFVPLPGINCYDLAAGAGAHVYSYQVKIDPSMTVLSTNTPDGQLQALEIG